jgi:hypothetical protein
MAYDFYLGKTRLPVTPQKLQLKIKNQNKTVTLIDDGEINLLRKAGLTEITFTAYFPNVKYPFTKYDGGFQGAGYFIDVLENLKTATDADGNLIPFQFIVSRVTPSGAVLFDTNIKVSLEDYKLTEDAKQSSMDVSADITLKQYIPYGTKTAIVKEPTAAQPATTTIEEPRSTESAPNVKSYTVISGDCLWNIAKRMLGDGARYTEIYTLNQSVIDGANSGIGNPKYTIYPNQVFTLPS